jgi:tetratricopeptide (TPR) repeat protein
MAQRLGDDEALAYALSARGYALMRPEVDPRERLALAERQLALAERAGARDVAAIGLQERLVCLLELGDGLRMDQALHDYARLVEAIGQPFFRWMSAAFACMRAFLDGRVADADRLAVAALRMGQRFGTPNALPAFSAQIFHVRREQGRLAELEPVLRRVLDQEPFVAAFRAGLCVIHAEMGKGREASDGLAQLTARGLDDAPLDQNWLGLLATLSRACVGLRDAATASLVYAKLRPYDGRIVALGHGVAFDGAVAYHLGTLAATSGDLDAAEDHYEAALTQHRRLGARLFDAHTQRELAEILRKRSRPGDRARAEALLAEAAAGYRTLGFAASAEAIDRTLG